jgi:hypothetical protein
VQGVLVAKTRFDQQRFGRVDQEEASFPLSKANIDAQHNPQEPVAAVEAQATRRVLLANRKLVAKREDLRLQGSTGSKTGGY